jgi:DNA-binding transcriptional ArsR family regulator
MDRERNGCVLSFHDSPASWSDVAKDPLQANHCAEQLKALSEPHRLRIVSALRAGPKSVSDLSEGLQVELVTVSHHLQILRNARIVRTERKGRFILYSLHEDVFQAAESGRASEHLDLGCCRLEIPRESR